MSASSSAPVDLFRRLTNGVYIIGVAHGPRRNAFTAAWLTQVSFAPLLVALSINPEHVSYPLLRNGRSFTVNILPTDRIDLADHFGTISGRTTDKLHGQSWRPSRNGCPILTAAIAVLECDLLAEHPAGDHALIVAQVIAGELLQPAAEPLGYRSTGNLDGSAALFPESF
jgi:flavin reductase (DIM6/NTAB) family NADH-FMN oxidoreductase RutF